MEPFDKYFFKCKLDFSKEQTARFQKRLIPVVFKILRNRGVVVVVLKVKLLLATNLGGGKLVLLASSEMEQDFLTLTTFQSLSFSS